MIDKDMIHEVEKLRKWEKQYENEDSSDTDTAEDDTPTESKLRYKEYMEANDKIDPKDPTDFYNTMSYTHNSTLIELKEDLLEAIQNRKKAVLPCAIKIFNKLQEKYVSQTTLSDYDTRKKGIDHSTGFQVQEEQLQDIS